jgi:hypothetical protein
MRKMKILNIAPALEIRGTVSTPTGKVVYQKVGRGFGNIANGRRYNWQQRRHVIPIDPKTTAQLAQRAKLRAANAAWHLLTPSEKSAFVTQAKQRGITTYNAYLSWHMQQVAPVTHTTWDAGSTTWDNNATVWD